MPEPDLSTDSAFVPYLSYRDAHAAITWLGETFGFEEQAAHDDDDGNLVHGEMAYGGARMMIGTGDPPPPGDTSQTSPQAHGIYVVVSDVDAHFKHASEAGAEIVYPPEDTEFGTRRYRVVDVEGYEWSFGSYSPFD